ncbi:MAG: LytR C-terminal domain-containing protein, partial [Candidatus Coatesbacteria bacterium]
MTIKNLAALAVAAALAAAVVGCGGDEPKRPVGEAVPIGEAEDDGGEKGGPADVRVAVYNACGVEGLAGLAADVLTEAGYGPVETANYVDPETGKTDYDRARTEVFYADDEHRDGGGAVAELFGVPTENVSKRSVAEDADVALILGADFDPTELVVKGGAETVVGDDFDWSAEPVEIKLGPPPDTLENGIYVSKGNHTVTLFEDGELVTQYPCAAGRDGSTPEGKFTINMKLVDPVWYWKGEAIPPGPENGLGSRFIGIT